MLFKKKYFHPILQRHFNITSPRKPKNFLHPPPPTKKEVKFSLAASSQSVPSVLLSAAIPLVSLAIRNGSSDVAQVLTDREVE